MTEPAKESLPTPGPRIERRREITNRVQEALIDVLQLDLEPEEIGYDSPLFGAGLGLDSVDAVGLAAMLEEHFGVQVFDTDIQAFRSLNTIVDFVLARQDELEAGREPEELFGATVPEHLMDAVDPGLAGRAPEAFADYVALRNRAGLVPDPGVAVVRVSGEGDDDLLGHVVAGAVDELPVGGLMHSMTLDAGGEILAILWLLRDDDAYLLLTDEVRGPLVLEALRRWRGELAPEAEVEDLTGSVRPIALIGPRAQDLVVDLLDEDLLRLAYAEHEDREWRGERILVGRFGETGEYDYRLLVPVSLYDDVLAEAEEAGSIVGLRRCRPAILPDLMLEMKTLHQGTAIPSGCLPSQADLQWMVDFRKGDFVGREGARRGLRNPGRRAILLLAEPEDEVAEGAEVWLDGRPAGTIKTSAVSYTLGRRVVLAYVEDSVAWPGVAFRLVSSDGPEAECHSAPLFLTRTVVEALNV
jgi:acyl carrier protein